METHAATAATRSWRPRPAAVRARASLWARRPDRGWASPALRQPRPAELPPRRGDHRRAGIPGSFADMLREVKASESNPPLYYVLAWGWAKAFGTGEVGTALALGALRRGHDPGRLSDRPRAGEPAGRADRRGARRRQPDADLVLAGGPLLRAAGLLLRALAALLPARPATAGAAGTWRSGRWPRRSRSAATTSPSSRSRSRRPGCLVALRAGAARVCSPDRLDRRGRGWR